MSVDYSQGAPPPPPQKKGLGVVGWIAIGCGVLFVICLIVMGSCFYLAKRTMGDFAKNPEMAAAKLLIKANPEVELVEADDEAKTFTVREKKTGKLVTINLADVKEGKLKISGGEGEASIDISGQGSEGGFNATVTDEKGQTSTMRFGAGGSANLPDWLPAYPGGSVQGNYDTTTPEGRSATVVVTTSDSPQAVLDFYRDKLKEAGLEATVTTQEGADGVSGTVTGNSSDQKRSVMVAVAVTEGKTQATVTFQEKN